MKTYLASASRDNSARNNPRGRKDERRERGNKLVSRHFDHDPHRRSAGLCTPSPPRFNT